MLQRRNEGELDGLALLIPRLWAGQSLTQAGSGPLVPGPTLALIMAMAGRTAYCDELRGDGAEILRSR